MTDSHDDSPSTGLPVLTTWRAVYWVVLAVFVLWVSALAILSQYYS